MIFGKVLISCLENVYCKPYHNVIPVHVVYTALMEDQTAEPGNYRMYSLRRLVGRGYIFTIFNFFRRRAL